MHFLHIHAHIGQIHCNWKQFLDHSRRTFSCSITMKFLSFLFQIWFLKFDIFYENIKLINAALNVTMSFEENSISIKNNNSFSLHYLPDSIIVIIRVEKIFKNLCVAHEWKFFYLTCWGYDCEIMKNYNAIFGAWETSARSLHTFENGGRHTDGQYFSTQNATMCDQLCFETERCYIFSFHPENGGQCGLWTYSEAVIKNRQTIESWPAEIGAISGICSRSNRLIILFVKWIMAINEFLKKSLAFLSFT